MKNSRRKFLKNAGMAGLGLAGSRLVQGYPSTPGISPLISETITANNINAMNQANNNISIIGVGTIKNTVP